MLKTKVSYYVGLIIMINICVFGVAHNALGDWWELDDNPIIIGTHEAYYPTILYDENQFNGHGETAHYKLWCDKNLQYYTSDDGTNWNLVGNIDDATITGLPSNIRHPLVEYYEDGFAGAGSGNNPSSDTMNYRIWFWYAAELYTVTAIHYAESADGKTWYNEQPLQNGAVSIVTGIVSDWNRGSYGPCDVLYFPGATNTGTDWTFRMYYDGTTGGEEFVGLGFSADGITWTGYDADSDGNADPVLSGGGPGYWDDRYASRSTVVYADGEYKMWYSGGQTGMNAGIGYATSTDGIAWIKDGNNPIFHRDDAGGDPGHLGYWRYNLKTYTPMVVFDENFFLGHGYANLMKMWLSGEANWNSLGSVIGYALFGYGDLDGDGLDDSIEEFIGTNPDNPDTDGDGIQDGTESGLTLENIPPYIDLSIFQPDLDPSTTTDPLSPDTDGDSLRDGDEDTKKNGRVDPGEQDPNLLDCDLHLHDSTVQSGSNLIYTTPCSITCGPNYIIEPSGQVNLHAGTEIIFNPGFTAEQGSSLETFIE